MEESGRIAPCSARRSLLLERCCPRRNCIRAPRHCMNPRNPPCYIHHPQSQRLHKIGSSDHTSNSGSNFDRKKLGTCKKHISTAVHQLCFYAAQPLSSVGGNIGWGRWVVPRPSRRLRRSRRSLHPASHSTTSLVSAAPSGVQRVAGRGGHCKRKERQEGRVDRADGVGPQVATTSISLGRMKGHTH
jgi:hypothetical protein